MDVATKARLGIVSAICAMGLSGCGNNTERVAETFPKTAAECSGTAVPNQYLVRYKSGETKVYRGSTREELIREVIEPNLESIDFAEQDQTVRTVKPDTLEKTEAGSDVGASAATDWWHTKIEDADAWSRGYRGQGVVVAVIDSGVQVTHNDLKNHLAVNTGETGVDGAGDDKATNGFDDDGNGYVDDVNGYDFSEDSGAVTDGSGHGTHVAGVVVADHASGTVYGAAPDARVLPLDFMDDDGAGHISDAIRAMSYAVTRGAKVINASWGGAPCSKSLRQAITDVGAQGVLVVTASGNEYASLDLDPTYPAAYNVSNQVTVGSSTMGDRMNDFSNYSYTLVHIMAPGSGILSTYSDFGSTANPRYKVLSGTSMATPFVAAAAAVLWSAKPTASVSDVRNALLSSVDTGPYQVSSRGRLNMRKALDSILLIP
ncbi:MAG: S8 family peptidase [Bdellovibrionota bacterium]